MLTAFHVFTKHCHKSLQQGAVFPIQPELIGLGEYHSEIQDLELYYIARYMCSVYMYIIIPLLLSNSCSKWVIINVDNYVHS